VYPGAAAKGEGHGEWAISGKQAREHEVQRDDTRNLRRRVRKKHSNPD